MILLEPSLFFSPLEDFVSTFFCQHFFASFLCYALNLICHNFLIKFLKGILELENVQLIRNSFLYSLVGYQRTHLH